MPYSEANLKLVFKPTKFYRDLALRTGKAEITFKKAMAKARKENLITQIGNKIELNKQARRLIDRARALKLTPLKSGHVLVLFDIPQSHDLQRRHFVRELKELGLVQIQKSVWATDKDAREQLLDLLAELKIGSYVAIALTHPVFGSHHFEN